jgi:hypothetical protein
MAKTRFTNAEPRAIAKTHGTKYAMALVQRYARSASQMIRVIPCICKHPMRATFRRRFRREMLCSLIGELRGKLHGGDGSLRP